MENKIQIKKVLKQGEKDKIVFLERNGDIKVGDRVLVKKINEEDLKRL